MILLIGLFSVGWMCAELSEPMEAESSEDIRSAVESTKPTYLRIAVEPNETELIAIRDYWAMDRINDK